MPTEVSEIASKQDVRAQARPRMLFTPARVDRLRRRLQADAAIGRQWEQILGKAETLLQATFVPQAEADQGSGQHANYFRPASQIYELAETLGLAYMVTGEDRYATKLREGLLHYAGYAYWCPPPMFERGWHSELQTAQFCMAYGIGCDLLHGRLSESDRAIITGAMVEKGILPIMNDWVLPQRRIHALDSMGHNWWSVCVSSAGLAALSLLGDDERALEWVKQAERGLRQWFEFRGNLFINKAANFDPAGAFYESVGYADYALREYLLFRLACCDVLTNPSPQAKVLGRMSDFFIHTFYPGRISSCTVDFGDHKSSRFASATMRLLLANGLGDGHTSWYLSRTEPVPCSPLAMLLDGDMPARTPHDLPTSVLYPEMGWAMLRSSWDDDATLLSVKSSHFWNHSHADAGSFILFHRGMPLITDSGACEYGRPEYVDYYSQSQAHNVMMLDGKGELEEDRMRGSKFPGSLRHLFDSAGLKYICADATGPMSHLYARHYRHWLWVDGVILVVDDLLAHEAGRFDWLLHYQGTAHRDGEEVVLSNGAARASVRFLYPTDLEGHEERGLAPYQPEERVPYLAFSTATPARRQYFICAIVPDCGQPTPQLEHLHDKGMLGVRVRHAQRVTDVYLNLKDNGADTHRNSCSVLGGWDTDATLLAITRPADSEADVDALVRYLVINGSYVRRSGRIVLDSLSKLDALVVPDERKMEVWVQGQQAIDLAIGSATRPASLDVDGRSTPIDYQPGRQVVRFGAGEFE